MKVTQTALAKIKPYANNPRRNEHTKPGAVCFEPFSGSGSQLIACEKEGRTCYAMELEPVFVEVAVRRWEAFTGKKAERTPAETPRREPAAAARGRSR